MNDFKNYNLENEIKKIKTTEEIPNDLDYYSSRKIIHQLYDIPSTLDINAYVFHGVNITDYEIKDVALDVNYPSLTTRQSQVEYLLNKGGDKNNIFSSGSLFARYRKLNDIKQSKNVKGTLAFFSHSCPQVDIEVDIEKYIAALKKLSEELKPINICFYYLDILKGRHKAFLDNGFNVYTAGHCNDPDFVDNFYEILRHHKYATSNVWGGSNLLYCIEFGIPTFIYGEESFVKYRPTAKFHETGVEDMSFYQECISITEEFFKKHFPKYPKIEISEESKKVILEKLGMDYQTPNEISRRAIIKYAKKQKQKKFFKKIKKFLFNREKIDNKRKITILGLIKFNYKKKLTQDDIAQQTKKIWVDVEANHFEAFKNSKIVADLNQDSICIDCGANVGIITELFANKGATVYSFEPQLQCYEELVKKFKDNDKVFLYQKGVLDKKSTMKLYKFKYHDRDELFFSQGSSLYSSNAEIDKNAYEEVELVDLTQFIEEMDKNIDVLKMDIEGAEFCVLEKLIDKGLYKKIKQILVETHDAEIPELKEIAGKVRKKIDNEKITNIDLTWV